MVICSMNTQTAKVQSKLDFGLNLKLIPTYDLFPTELLP